MSSIREFYSKDHILRASFPGQPFLCLLIKADKLVENQELLTNKPLETIVLGDMLMAVALTAATLKGQQRVQEFSTKANRREESLSNCDRSRCYR